MTSKDGTTIRSSAWSPAVIVVGGVIDDGTENAPLAPANVDHYPVYNFARRAAAQR